MSEVVALLGDLVGIDSTNPPGNEIEVAQALSTWLADRGIGSEIDEFEPGRANLVARLDGRERGPALMFNTHTDVVPAGEGWTKSAFEAVVADGVLYGRGSADSKGSLAAMAVAFAELAGDREAMAGSVILAAVADEELSSRGARRLLEHTRADAVIVGEPTDLRLMTAHKGSLRPIVEVRGVSAHAALPQHGRNALEGAAHLLVRLPALRQSLRERTHPLVGSPTVVPVLVEGGEAPNMVPRTCRITFDRRLVPGETDQAVIDEFTAWLSDFETDGDGFAVAIVDLAPSTGGPSETDTDHPFVRACQTALADVGLATELAGLVVNCDMTHFRAAGIPTVVCGPGSPGAMHVRDESVPLSALEQAVAAYGAMARRWLGGAA